MADEIVVTSSLQINKGNFRYRSPDGSFRATLAAAAAKGPTPGALTITSAGETITFAELAAMGGMLRLTNTSSSESVEYGTYAGSTFRPLGEIGPGETYVLRSSRNLRYGATGTAHVQDFFMRSFGVDCVVVVEGFEP